jgi:hypothetical protein
MTQGGHLQTYFRQSMRRGICIVDDAGRIVREVKVASEPDALLAVLKSGVYHFKRIGLEAGPLSQGLGGFSYSLSSIMSGGDQCQAPAMTSTNFLIPVSYLSVLFW